MKGDLSREIRRVASRRKSFTWEHVAGPFPKLTIMRVMHGLHQRGELVRIRKGQVGANGTPAVYRAP